MSDFTLYINSEIDIDKPEVNGTAVVGVEGPEDILAEVVCVTTRKYLGVHGYEFGLAQLSTGAVSQETFIPFLKI